MNNERQPTQSADTFSQGGGVFQTLFHRIVIVMSIILVLLIIAVLVIRKKVNSTISPTEFAVMQRLETTTLSLPRDWHSPADVPPADVVEFHQRFQTQMQRLRSRHEYFIFGNSSSASGATPYEGVLESYWTSGTLTDAERTSFSLLVAHLQPIINETSAAVSLPGYTTELDSTLLMINFLETQTFAKLLAILANEQATAGDCDEAFDTVMLLLRLTRRPEQSSTITHLIGVAQANIAARTLYNITEKCDDPAALQEAIRDLNAAYDKLFPGDISDWFHEDIALLRFAAAYGYPVDLSPQTHANFTRQRARLYTLPYWEFLVGKFPSSDQRNLRAKQYITEYKSQRAAAKPMERLTNSNYMSPFQQKLYGIVTGVDPTLLRYGMVSADVEEARTRAYVAKASIDLARLAMAQRLTELTGAAATDQTTASISAAPDAAAITAYINPPPVDPFTSGTYPYAAAISRHYSAGPDLDDDKGAILYDATNGTTSNGDLWLDKRW